jgi:hypothetical protein
MIVENGPAKEIFTLFPEKAPFYYNVPIYYGGEDSCNNNTNNYEASTYMGLPSFFFFEQQELY